MTKVAARVEVLPDRCTGCEYCVAFCPTQCIKMNTEYNAKGYHFPVLVDETACTGCEVCSKMCPEWAIEVYRAERRVASAR